jgi:adenylate cyclase
MYERLGPRYPLAVLLLDVAILYLVFGVAVALLPAWVDMSVGQFVEVLVAALVLQTIMLGLSAPELRSRVRPMVEWLRGARGRESAEAAWRAGAALPQQFVFQSRFNVSARVALLVAWAGFASWRLGLPAYAVPVLAAGALVAGLYANALMFLTMEIDLQPLLFEIAQQLGEVPIDDRVRVPLRRRLLVAVPSITIISGVAVAGLAGTGHAGVGRLAIDLLFAVSITATIVLVLTVLLAGSIVDPIHSLRAATERVARGDLTVRVPVVSSDETGELTRSFNRMVAGLQERERLHTALGTFVDPELAERVLHEGTDLAGEEIELSILFMDVRGFTSFAERAHAHDVVARLNDLYGRVVPVVLRHGGHANKFIGDGLLAIFGAPERYQDHADRAVAAALEIAALVSSRYGDSLRVGIGVNSGLVVVGTIGGGGRLDFTVIGDPVNTAARVEAATRQTGDDVLITGVTYALLSQPFGNWQPRPALPLKGKTQTVALFAPSAQPVETGRTRRATPADAAI